MFASDAAKGKFVNEDGKRIRKPRLEPRGGDVE